MMEPENLAKLYEAQPGNKWPIYKSLVDSPVYQENELLAEMARRRSRTASITGIKQRRRRWYRLDGHQPAT